MKINFKIFESVNRKDVTKMPIIGIAIAAGILINGVKSPDVEYDIVAIIDGNKNDKIYVTNQWHKEGRVPLMLHQDLVKSYTEI